MSHILYVPNPTGTGHNMRTLALAQEIHAHHPDIRQSVLVGSMQTVFTPLFTAAGMEVIPTGSRPVDSATTEHLHTRIDQETFIDGFVVPTFLNGSKLIDYLAYYETISPDLVVSDYNLTASIAAIIGGYRHVLTTERYDFSLVQVSDQDFIDAGFDLNAADIDHARGPVSAIFDWIITHSVLVVTDKPPVDSLDAGTALYRHLHDGNVHFVGPMIRPLPPRHDPAETRRRLGLGQGPVIVASVGGMTMLMDDKTTAIAAFRETFARVRRTHPDTEMVLIGREQLAIDDPGVHEVAYLPDWMPLLQDCAVLVTAPGWITVTEAAALGVPTIFMLEGPGEYHEIEALRRLTAIGLPTLDHPDPDQLTPLLTQALDGGLASCAAGFAVLAPHGRGTPHAADLIAATVEPPAWPPVGPQPSSAVTAQ